MKTFSVPIQSIVQETPRVKSFYFNYPLQADPGQFLLVDVPKFGKRPFGAVVVDAKTFLISVGKAGDATTFLHTLEPGAKLTIEGPIGTAFTLPQQKSKLALVAGGYGLAPLGYLAKKAAENGHEVTIFAGARTSNEFISYPFLQQQGIQWVKTTDDGTEGQKGFVTDAFEKSCKENKFDQVYIVGPPPMQNLAITICRQNNIEFQVSMAEYAYEDFGPVVTGKKLLELQTTGPVVV